MAKDTLGKSDPYVVLRLGNQSKMTSVKSNTLDPVFGEDFAFVVEKIKQQVLDIQVFDKNMLTKQTLGTVSISAQDIAEAGINGLSQDYALRNVPTGKIHLSLRMIVGEVEVKVGEVEQGPIDGELRVTVLRGENLEAKDTNGFWIRL